MSEDATPQADEREALINLAIYDYHAAVDRGESPDPVEWANARPEISTELAAYFDDLAKLDLLAPVMSSDRNRARTTDSWSPRASGAIDPHSSAESPRPGDLLGDYVILERLGEGGQGVVWKACAKDALEIVVALKTLRSSSARDPASTDRLRADARAIAQMRHVNIIKIFYFGEDRGRRFFVMELMEGGTVADRLASYVNDPRSAAILVEKVARAVHHAHTRNPGVIHLDLKPRNILLSSEGSRRSRTSVSR